MVRPKQVSDQELLQAAREAFVRHGPKTAIAQIADRLGVSAAALFQRVGSKAQLMLLALLPGVPEALTAFARGPEPDQTISAQLQKHLSDLMTFFKAVVPSLIVLRAAGLFPPPRHRGRRHNPEQSNTPTPIALREQLAHWLTTARSQGRVELRDPHACAEGMLGAMEARCFNAHVGGDDYIRGTDSEFIAALIGGLIHDLDVPSAGKPRTRKR
jgi:AcrR family transcriptional regulator